MSTKDSALLVVGSMSGVAGALLEISNNSGADFLKGFGAGMIVVFCINVIPKIIKKRNETIAE